MEKYYHTFAGKTDHTSYRGFYILCNCTQNVIFFGSLIRFILSLVFYISLAHSAIFMYLPQNQIFYKSTVKIFLATCYFSLLILVRPLSDQELRVTAMKVVGNKV